MQAGVQICAGRSSWFKMHMAVLTGVCVKGPVVNQHALSLYTDASFLVTPHTLENWTLQGAQQFPLCWKLSASPFAIDSFCWLLEGTAGTFHFLWGSFNHSSPLQKWYLYTSLWEVVRPGRHVFMPHICIYTYIMWRDTSILTCRPRQNMLKQWHRGFAFYPQVLHLWWALWAA